MQKIAIITDSASDIPLEVIKEKNINLLPLRIIYSHGDYQDKLDITPEEIYLNLDKEIPTTSLPSAQTMDDILNKLESEGYTHVIAICISGGLSGTCNSLRLILEDHPKLTSYVYDTKILAYPEGEVVLEAVKLVEAGKSFEEIVESLPKIRERITGFYTVNTLEYLQKGGRIGKVAGTIGELLNLKPIITTDETGVYYTICKARGRKQALSKMTNLLKEKLAIGKCEVTVLECACKEEATKFMEQLAKLPNVENIKLNVLSPALGIHGGPGLLGLSVKLVE